MEQWKDKPIVLLYVLQSSKQKNLNKIVTCFFDNSPLSFSNEPASTIPRPKSWHKKKLPFLFIDLFSISVAPNHWE